MITIYLKQYNKIIRNADTGLFEELGYDDILWIDMLQPTIKEQKAVENFMEINLQTKQQVEEIESTSKYSETENAIISNANFFVPTGESFVIEPVSFIISNEGVLVSVRQAESRTFQETEKRLQINYRNYPTGYHIFITLLEVRIDYDADMVELIARQVSSLSRNINGEDSIDKEVLRRINTLQESTMLLRENIFDRQRVLSGILRSERFPNDIYPRLQLMIKDVNSLINHADFSFQRLDYIQDAALGLINIEQNEIVKIFSVAAVIFMPATLIARYELFDPGIDLEVRLPVCHRIDDSLLGFDHLVLPFQKVVIKTVRFDFGFVFVDRGVFYLFRKSFPKPGRNKVRIRQDK